MSFDGFAGFPLLDGIPRGQAFVDPGRGRGRSGTPVPHSSTGSAGLASARPVPGGFNDSTADVTLSDTSTDIGNGATRQDITKERADGSTVDQKRFNWADGSKTVQSERRSLPDAEGYQKVRVREETIAPDGTRDVTINVYRVPAGLSVDWNSPDAQRYFLSASNKTLPPGAQWEDVPAEVPVAPGIAEQEAREQDATTAAERAAPTIPIQV